MATTYLTHGGGAYANGTTVQADRPSVAAGNLIIARIISLNSNITFTAQAGGWTQNFALAFADDFSLEVWSKTATGSEAISYGWNASANVGFWSLDYTILSEGIVDGVSASTSSGATQIIAPSLPVYTGGMIVLLANAKGFGSWSVPGAYPYITERHDAGTGWGSNYLFVGTGSMSTGPSGSHAMDFSANAPLGIAAVSVKLGPSPQTISVGSASSLETLGTPTISGSLPPAPTAPLAPFAPSKRSAQLSGIEVSHGDNPDASIIPTSWTYQTFRLPSDYKRITHVPDITGVQLCLEVINPEEFLVNLKLEVYHLGEWVPLTEGSVNSVHATGDHVWADIYFTNPIIVNPAWLTSEFRIGVRSNHRWWSSDGTQNYRILAATADAGVDFLGNKYRSVVTRRAVSNFRTINTDQVNGYWLSKPNPSKFAVESLYFNIQTIDGKASVIDRVLVDPITPGVVFHVYYSDDGEPGTTDTEWDQKLWQPIAYSFKAERRQEHALPEPIAAKYVKIEFSHLQAQHYSPGTFHQPTRYKKHPKWVLDYYLAKINQERTTVDPFIAKNVSVVFDAFSLAYGYYLDDLSEGPLDPETLRPTHTQLANFLGERQDVSDKIDPDTLERIKLSLAPYQKTPAHGAKSLEYLPGMYVETTLSNNYPVEKRRGATADTISVSSTNRESLLIEHKLPPMAFYLKCRHTYREVEAGFREDRAYFVGVRELAFTRDHYATASDNELYVDTLADFSNLMRNDFIEDGAPLGELGRLNVDLMQGFWVSSVPPADAVSPITITQTSSGFGGIPTGQGVGTPTINMIVAPTSITSVEAVSNISVTNAYTAYPQDIGSEEALGEPTIVMTVAPNAIASDEAFGSPTVEAP